MHTGLIFPSFEWTFQTKWAHVFAFAPKHWTDHRKTIYWSHYKPGRAFRLTSLTRFRARRDSCDSSGIFPTAPNLCDLLQASTSDSDVSTVQQITNCIRPKTITELQWSDNRKSARPTKTMPKPTKILMASDQRKGFDMKTISATVKIVFV